jgi:hypothetical protein
METNRMEMGKVNEVSNKAAETAIRELTELELVVTGGGGAIAQFG